MNLHPTSASLAVSCLALLSLAPSAALAAAGTEPGLRAALAREDITPTQPVTLAGYSSRKDLSQGVHDPLSARVVAFEEGGQRLVIVVLDSIGFYGQTAAPLRQAILDTCGLQPAELLLAATHSHSSPGLTLDPARGHAHNLAYTRRLQTRLPEVVRATLARLEPVRMSVGLGAAPVASNRREPVRDVKGGTSIRLGRNPARPIDREVQVLKLTRVGAGTLVGAVFGFATHSTAMGPRSYQISGDVHGLAAQFIERYLGEPVVAPALVGASGDIDPWFRVLPEFNTRNGWIPEAVLLGTLLGEEVVHTLNRATKPGAGGPIRALTQAVELPAKPRSRTGEPVSTPTLPFQVAVARVGEVAFVGLGGEVGNEIGMAIKEASPFGCTVVITHCNGAAGYLVPAHYFPEGGYEVDTSPFTAGAAATLIDETVRLLRSL